MSDLYKTEGFSLTEQLRDRIVRDILNGTYLPGGKLPTERQLETCSGTSRITVRRAYAQLEKAGIIERKRSAGTIVCRSFRAHAQMPESIGLITVLPNEFSRQFVESVCRRCFQLGVLTSLCIPEPNTGEEQFTAACRMTSRGIRNLIVWGADDSIEFSSFERLRILGANLVFFDQVLPGPCADFIGLNNHDAIESLITQALKDGAEFLEFLDWPDSKLDSNRERRKAFEEIAARTALPFRVREIPDGIRSCDAASDVRRILEDCRKYAASAVIAVNSPLLLSLFRDKHEKIRFYCVDFSEKLHSLHGTGYAQPIREMGAAAVDALFEQCRMGMKWKASVQRFNGKVMCA